MNLDLLVQRSVSLLQAHAPSDGKPYLGAFSGGKDSVVIKELARMAEVPVEWHYHVTTIDPPELVQFVRNNHPDVIWDRATTHPKKKQPSPLGHLLMSRALYQGFPTRKRRWCCKQFKEGVPISGTPQIIGVRIAESPRRKGLWTACTMPHREDPTQKIVLPIRLWEDKDVWDFIRWRKIPYCSLYDEGFDRLGCVGCPMITQSQRARQFARWPAFERQWKRMFERLWEKRANVPDRNGNVWWGARNFASWQELYAWWDSGQGSVTAWKKRQTAVRPKRRRALQLDLFSLAALREDREKRGTACLGNG